jgi:hypothetical protein
MTKKIETTGGAYHEREGITVEHDEENKRIRITGWYDGGCNLDIELLMPTDEFCKRLGLSPNEKS